MAISSSVRTALERYRDRLRLRFGERLRAVVLFGSHARGQAHEDSDVDVLVVVDGLTSLEAWEAAGDVAPVAIETRLPLAPLPISTERLESLRKSERLLAQVIDSEGIAL